MAITSPPGPAAQFCYTPHGEKYAAPGGATIVLRRKTIPEDRRRTDSYRLLGKLD